MTLGRLAAVTVSANTNTLIQTVPAKAGIYATTVNIINLNDEDVVIRLAFVDGVLVDLSTEDWIEYDVTIRANGIIERTQIKMAPGQSIVGYSDTNNVNFQVWHNGQNTMA